MNCDFVQDCLVDYVLGDISQSDEEVVEEHLRHGCDACRQELAELREGIGVLYDSIAAGRETDEKVEELVHSVLCHGLVTADPPMKRNYPWFSTFDSMLFAASFAAGLLLAFTLGLPGIRLAHESSSGLQGQAQFPTEGHEIVLTSVKAQNLNSPVSGVLLYDSFLRELHFFAPKIAKPAAGKQYVLMMYQGEEVKSQPISIDTSGVGTATVGGVPLNAITDAVIELRTSPSSY